MRVAKCLLRHISQHCLATAAERVQVQSTRCRNLPRACNPVCVQAPARRAAPHVGVAGRMPWEEVSSDDGASPCRCRRNSESCASARAPPSCATCSTGVSSSPLASWALMMRSSSHALCRTVLDESATHGSTLRTRPPSEPPPVAVASSTPCRLTWALSADIAASLARAFLSPKTRSRCFTTSARSCFCNSACRTADAALRTLPFESPSLSTCRPHLP